MFEKLTAFLPLLSGPRHGTWRGGPDSNGFIQFPWVDYEPHVLNFIGEVYKFESAHEDMGLRNYSSVFGAVGVEWDFDSMSNAEVSQFDGKTVVALIVGAIRADRFCEGAFLHFLSEGIINRWLERLKELDEFDSSS